MFTGDEIVNALQRMRITHVIWLPDSTLGPWEHALEACGTLELVRVCREGESWPLAAGLLVGGQSPIVLMQCTGFFESGDAMRNVVHDLRLPLFAVVGVRNWLRPMSADSARQFAEPVAAAWGFHAQWITCEADQPQLETHYARCRRRGEAGLVLLAEGQG